MDVSYCLIIPADSVHGFVALVLQFKYLLIIVTPYYSHSCDVKSRRDVYTTTVSVAHSL